METMTKEEIERKREGRLKPHITVAKNLIDTDNEVEDKKESPSDGIRHQEEFSPAHLVMRDMFIEKTKDYITKHHFGVSDAQIKIMATEMTREYFENDPLKDDIEFEVRHTMYDILEKHACKKNRTQK